MGTAPSRATGLLRTMALASALGVAGAAVYVAIAQSLGVRVLAAAPGAGATAAHLSPVAPAQGLPSEDLTLVKPRE